MQTNGKREHAHESIMLLLCGLLLLSCSAVVAQTGSKTPPPSRPANPMSADKGVADDDDPPLTTYEEEIRAKRLIKIAEKEHQDNVNRAREISQLGKQLQETLKTRNALDREDSKKLERIEKLTRKIRGEAGGGDDEVKLENRPIDLPSTLTRVAEVTECLSKNVQNTPRQVISAAVIDNANVLLELIKIMRTFSR
jgi:hypothetical protein